MRAANIYMSHKPASNQLISNTFVIFIILLGLLLAFNMGGTGFLGVLVLLFIIGSAFSVVLHKKPVSHFIGMLLGLIIGPVIVCCVLRLLLTYLRSLFLGGLGNFGTVFLLLLMVISFFYVRRRILATSKHEAKELQTNERRPVLPPHSEGENLTEHHHARD